MTGLVRRPLSVASLVWLLPLLVVSACQTPPDESASSKPNAEARPDTASTSTRAHARPHGTELPPDDPETATDAPAPEDLARYTRDMEGDGPLRARIETTEGGLKCRLFEDHAPVTVANFVGLARGLKAFVEPGTDQTVSGIRYYDGVGFHRVIPGVLAQTGDRTGRGHGGPGYTIPDELSDELRHDRSGVLSMANRGPDTAGSQFFLTERPLPHLDDHHTIFGHCEPKSVIRQISHVPTTGMNRPVDPGPRIETIRFSRAD